MDKEWLPARSPYGTRLPFGKDDLKYVVDPFGERTRLRRQQLAAIRPPGVDVPARADAHPILDRIRLVDDLGQEGGLRRFDVEGHVNRSDRSVATIKAEQRVVPGKFAGSRRAIRQEAAADRKRQHQR
jgi:hypothetical protein